MDFLKTLANDVHVVRGDFDDVSFTFLNLIIFDQTANNLGYFRI